LVRCSFRESIQEKPDPVDCVCLQITFLNGTTIEVNEDMKGWKNLLSALPSVLPGLPEVNSWLGKVTLPPFAAQLTELWKRQD
jgi:hypothetical protein